MTSGARVTAIAQTVLVALALAAPAAEAAPKRAEEPKPEEWVERFYEQPRIDLLARMVWFLDRAGTLDQDRARLAGFFSVLFRRPGADAPRFVNTASVSLPGRYTLVEALWLAGQGEAAYGIARSRGMKVERLRRPAPDLRTAPIRTGEDVDRLWGAYLASGDAGYPRRLVDLLDRARVDGTDGLEAAHLGSRALTSLDEHARRHASVLRLVREEAPRRKGPSRGALAGILYRLDAEAAARSQRMLRLVVKGAPGAGAGAVPRPLRLLRLGDAFGRLEPAPGPGAPPGKLMVTAAPDEWIVDTAEGHGLHHVQPGPAFGFRPTIVPPGPDGRAPTIEFGRELEYLRARGATRETRMVSGVTYAIWSLREGTYFLELYVDPDTDRPRRVHVRRTGRTVAELEYLSYERDLPPDLGLFARPPGAYAPAR